MMERAVMSPEFLLRTALQVVSALFGGSGVFFVWTSFHSTLGAAYAILFLSIASCITLALPKAAR
jgi:hypothetical protein